MSKNYFKKAFAVFISFVMVLTILPKINSVPSIMVQAVDVRTYSVSSDGNTYLSKNFKVSEFACKDGSDEVLIDLDLVHYLQQIRDHFGSSVKINSGYRTPSYNSKVGGAKSSYHTKGQAADIVVSGVSPLEVAKYAETIGMYGIGLYDGFTHVDTRSKSNKFFWKSSSQIAVSTFGGTPDPDPDYKLVTPTISTNKSSYTVGETVYLSWAASPSGSNLSHYWLNVIAPDGTWIYGGTMNKETSYSFVASQSGDYCVTTYATPIGSKDGEGSLTDTKIICVKENIPNFSASTNNININMDNNERKYVEFTYGNYSGSISMFFDHGDTSISQLEWGEWEGNSVKLYVSGFRTGNETITVSLKDNDTNQILGAIKVVIVVSGDFHIVPEKENYTLDLDAPQTIKITGNCYSFPTSGLLDLVDENGNSIDYNNGIIKGDFKAYRDGSKIYVTAEVEPIKIGTSDYFFQYSDNGEVKNLASVHVTVTGSHKVTFDANGGEVSTTEKIVKHNSELGELPIPVRQGYTFTGWKYDLTSKAVNSDDKVTSEMTLRATWKNDKPVVMTINVNGDESCIVKPGDLVTITLDVDGAEDGFCSGGLLLEYDNLLEIIPYSNFSYAEKGDAVERLLTLDDNYAKGNHNEYVFTFTGTENAGKNGNVYSLTFKVSEEAKNGDEILINGVMNDWTMFALAKGDNINYIINNCHIYVENENDYVDDSAQPIWLEKTETTLSNGEKYKIVSNQDNLTYKSNNTNVVVVSKTGIITAIGEGNAIVSVINADGDVSHINVTVLSVISGDCNNDGEFNISDAVLLQKWLLAVPDTHLANWKAADLCEDDKLDVFDLCLIKRMLVGKS